MSRENIHTNQENRPLAAGTGHRRLWSGLAAARVAAWSDRAASRGATSQSASVSQINGRLSEILRPSYPWQLGLEYLHHGLAREGEPGRRFDLPHSLELEDGLAHPILPPLRLKMVPSQQSGTL